MFTETNLPNTDFHHYISHYSEENIRIVLVPTIMTDKIMFVVTYAIFIFLLNKSYPKLNILNRTWCFVINCLRRKIEVFKFDTLILHNLFQDSYG